MYLLTKALVYTFFYAALVYLPLRVVIALVGKHQVRAAKRRAAEQARKIARARAAF